MPDVLNRLPREWIYWHHFVFRGTQRCIESWLEGTMEIIRVVIYLMLLAPFHIVGFTNDHCLILLKFCLDCLVEVVVLFIVIPVALPVLVNQVIRLFVESVVVS